jgi:hypothetical protein
MKVFFTDNGRILCGEHLGVTARATGRDLSGDEIVEVDPASEVELRKAHGPAGKTIALCERCQYEARRR